jgi:hypothetical protein
MHSFAGTRDEAFHLELGRRAAAMPVQLWQVLATRWQGAAERRVERMVRATGHEGVAADYITAKRST